MALFQCSYPSNVMNKYMQMNVILPENEEMTFDNEGKYPVIYLYHGYTDDYTKWMRLTAVERYANDYGIAVVMPDAGKSFYTDMVYGDPYFTHLTEEVPELVKKWYPITKDPKHTYIAGLSMGGYGAAKIGFTYPERFNGVGIFSGALAMSMLATAETDPHAEDWLKRLDKDLPLVFGDATTIPGSPNDDFWLVSKAVQESKPIPNLYICCGTEDFVYQNTVAFCQHLQANGIDYTYSEEPETHNWGYWDRQLEEMLKWIKGL